MKELTASMFLFYQILDKNQKKNLIYLTLLNMVSAFFEIFSIGMIIPFITFLTSPSVVLNHPIILTIEGFLGIQFTENLFVPICVAMIIVTILSTTIRIAAIKRNAYVAFSFGNKISIRLYSQLIRKNYLEYSNSHSADDLSVLVPKVNTFINAYIFPVIQLLAAAVMFIIVGGCLLILNWQASIITITAVVVTYIVISKYNRFKLDENSSKLSILHGQQLRAAQDSLALMKDIILNKLQAYVIDKYNEIDQKLRNKQASNIIIAQSPRFIIEALTIIFLVLATLFLFYGADENSRAIALPILIVIVVALQRLLPITQQAYRSWASIVGNNAISSEILALVNVTVPDVQNKNIKQKVLEFNSSIELKRVSYSHQNGGKNIINNVNIKINKNDKIGIIGSTGSGKSTLIDIIMGLKIPETGAVFVDGKKLNDENTPLWYDHIAHVPQNVILLDTSFAKNIAFGDLTDEIDNERLQLAVNLSGVSEFISNKGLTLDEMVGERGKKLSGGQIQRVGIARGIYKNSSVIFLDEITSALDTETEKLIMKNINKLNKTTFIISHNLLTLKNCDSILEFLENGRIKQWRFNQQNSFDEFYNSIRNRTQ